MEWHKKLTNRLDKILIFDTIEIRGDLVRIQDSTQVEI